MQSITWSSFNNMKPSLGCNCLMQRTWSSLKIAFRSKPKPEPLMSYCFGYLQWMISYEIWLKTHFYQDSTFQNSVYSVNVTTCSGSYRLRRMIPRRNQIDCYLVLLVILIYQVGAKELEVTQLLWRHPFRRNTKCLIDTPLVPPLNLLINFICLDAQ